ncbi:MAG: hypothetical protein WD825_11545 [Gemmatimonadaceae bacterium]
MDSEAAEAAAEKAAAYRFLTQLQEKTLSELGEYGDAERESIALLRQKLDPAFLERVLESFHPDHRDHMRDELTKSFSGGTEPFTPYENPFWQTILGDISTDLEAVIAKLSLPRPHRIWFGSLPSRRVNALALKHRLVPGRFVLFESHFFVFALLFTKAVAYALPFKETAEGGLTFSTAEEDVERHIRGDGRAIQRFSEALLAYVLDGTPVKAPSYIQEWQPSKAATEFREALEYFVMGHEYGHVLAGHLEIAHGSGALMSFSEEADELVASHQQEFEADWMGLMLTFHALKDRTDLTLVYTGVELFFTIVELVYRAVAKLSAAEESDRPYTHDAHPPPEVRLERLAEAVRYLVPNNAERILAFPVGVRHATTLLWEAAEARLDQAVSEGAQLAPIWR